MVVLDTNRNRNGHVLVWDQIGLAMEDRSLKPDSMYFVCLTINGFSESIYQFLFRLIKSWFHVCSICDIIILYKRDKQKKMCLIMDDMAKLSFYIKRVQLNAYERKKVCRPVSITSQDRSVNNILLQPTMKSKKRA